MRSEEKVIITVVVLVAILVVGVIASVFIFFNPSSLINQVTSRPGPVEVFPLVLYINYPSSSDNYFGSPYRLLRANPMYLQHSQLFSASFVLTLRGSAGSRSVNSISLGFSRGFTLVSISPVLPRAMPVGTSQNFTLTLQAPDTDDTGPVTIDLFTS